MSFASVFLDENNISLLLLEKGMGNVQFGKEQSFYIKEMKDAEKKAQEARIGVWKEGIVLQKLVDYTGEKSGAKAK